MKVADKIWVVTGAGGGIGGELVSELLAGGAKVAAVDLKQASLSKLKKRLKAGDELSLHAVNITDRKKVAKLPAEVKKAHGQVDGLVNCAGIIQPFTKIVDLDYTSIDKVMDVNFFGMVNMTKALLPGLTKRPNAHIVNVSSMGGFLPVPGQTLYGASKAAVKLFTEGLYAEMLHTNVKVSVVFPGATKTNITKNSGVKTPGGKQAAKAAEKFPMLSANKAAQSIVKGIEKDKPRIFTGNDSKSMNRLYRLAPVHATKFITRQMKSLLS